MKAFLENIFTRTSIKPVHRTKIGTNEVFIADGFVEKEQLPSLHRAFPSALKTDLSEFPNGCYATIWLTPGRIASRGGIRVASPDNNVQITRINQIIDDATEELTRTVH